MKVSQAFMRDFAYLANLYAWDASDIEDVKAQTRANPEAMRRYWIILAAAHRNGYQQSEANGYQRLGQWISLSRSFAEQYAPAQSHISARIAHACEAGGLHAR